jgi:hypothetical protein
MKPEHYKVIRKEKPKRKARLVNPKAECSQWLKKGNRLLLHDCVKLTLLKQNG